MLTPEEIASRQFLVALRGYDRDEVTEFLQQVADERRQLEERIAELERQLEERPEAPEGQDKPATAPVPTRSTTAAEVEPAEPDHTQAFRALGEETTRILVAAEESASSIRRKAEERAKNEVEQARREARDEVSQARRTASKIVSDAERRRSAVAEEIRTLETTRDSFLGDLRSAMSAVSGAIRGMEPSVQSGDRGGDSDDGGSGGGEEGSSEDSGEPAPPAPTPSTPAPEPTWPVAAETVEPEPEHAEPDAPEPEQAEREDEEPLAEAERGDDEPLAEAERGDDEPQPEDDEALSRADAVMDATDQAIEDAVAAASDLEEATTRAARAAAETEQVSDTEGASESQEASRFEEASESPEASESEEGLGPVALRLRTESLGAVRAPLLRRLKRALQDVQNVTLAALRTEGSDAGVDSLLPREEALEPVGEALRTYLEPIYRSGLADGAALADAEVPEGATDESRIPTVRATFSAVLGHEVTAALRATLQAGIDAGEPETSLSERVGEIFLDLKGPTLARIVDKHLMRAYAFGQIDAWRGLGIDAKAWIPGDAPRCPEEMRRQNAEEGAVGLDAEFPTGEVVPPAHDGCNCALVPS